MVILFNIFFRKAFGYLRNALREKSVLFTLVVQVIVLLFTVEEALPIVVNTLYPVYFDCGIIKVDGLQKKVAEIDINQPREEFARNLQKPDRLV